MGEAAARRIVQLYGCIRTMHSRNKKEATKFGRKGSQICRTLSFRLRRQIERAETVE